MKHERAIVMGLAYFIGFTTSFIGYGLVTGQNYEAPFVAYSGVTQMASLSSIPSASLESFSEAFSVSSDERDLSSDLYATLGEESHLVSSSYYANQELGDDSHVSVTFTVPNEATKQVFFCRTTVSSYESCDAFVYDWNTNTNYRLMKNGEKVVLSVSDISAVWNDDGRLNLNGQSSLTPGAPWQF